MKKTLMLGVVFLISGLVITYFLVSSILKLNQKFTEIQEATEGMFYIQENMVYSSSLIGGVFILIGFYLIKKSFSKSV